MFRRGSSRRRSVAWLVRPGIPPISPAVIHTGRGYPRYPRSVWGIDREYSFNTRLIGWSKDGLNGYPRSGGAHRFSMLGVSNLGLAQQFWISRVFLTGRDHTFSIPGVSPAGIHDRGSILGVFRAGIHDRGSILGVFRAGSAPLASHGVRISLARSVELAGVVAQECLVSGNREPELRRGSRL